MSIIQNPITGNFDEVEVPLRNYVNVDPTMNGNGDLAICFKNGSAYLYWKTNGQVFSRRAIQG